MTNPVKGRVTGVSLLLREPGEVKAGIGDPVKMALEEFT